ncbi:MAG: MarR family transcriptional regulator [Candidatus Woesearchaeota archaeon]|nr:MarR family transcriptional regulator [Candidatus Woesearchaeota archaeon]
MKSKQLGIMLAVISVIVLASLIFFIRSFDKHLTEACVATCGTAEGSTCSEQGCPYIQGKGLLWIPLATCILIAVVGGIGLFLAFSKSERVIQQKEYDIHKLNEEEKKAFLLIKDHKEGMYQTVLAEHLKFTKVQATRLVDKLEQYGLVERKRRGMSNVIFLK